MSEDIFDILGSIYSTKVVYDYFSYYLIHYINENINDVFKDKIAKSKIKKIELLNNTVVLGKLKNDYIYFNLSNNDKKDIIIPKKITDKSIDILKNCIDNIINLYSNTLKEKLDSKKIIKNTLKKIKLKEIIPYIQRHHHLPFYSKGINKSYSIKTKKYENAENIKGELFYLYRKNDISTKLQIKHFLQGISYGKEDTIISIRLRYFLNNSHIKKLKNRFSGKNFNNTIFQLLSCYNYNEFFDDNLETTLNPLEITNEKLKNIYDLSTELVGTPFNCDKPYYSLYPNIEKYFGSIGSFYNFKPNETDIQYYSITTKPSYYFIKDTYEKVKLFLKDFKGNKLSFLLWIPTHVIIYKEIVENSRNTLLKKVHKEIVPNIENSKYLKNKFYYKFYKDKANKSNFVVYHLQN